MRLLPRTGAGPDPDPRHPGQHRRAGPLARRQRALPDPVGRPVGDPGRYRAHHLGAGRRPGQHPMRLPRRPARPARRLGRRAVRRRHADRRPDRRPVVPRVPAGGRAHRGRRRAQRGARGAVIAGAIPADQRVRTRAYLRATTNVGISVGAVLAGFAIAADTRAGYSALILADGGDVTGRGGWCCSGCPHRRRSPPRRTARG